MRVLLFVACLGLIPCFGDTVDSTSIKQLIEKMDDSLVQGQIYHIEYVVTNRTFDAFYAHKREMIKFIEEGLVKEQSNTPPDLQQRLRTAVAVRKKALNSLREQTFFMDFSLDGKGFYLKLSMSSVDADGKAKSEAPSIFVSDGKVMGTFYMDQSQAVIQPATERPTVPLETWTEMAYLFLRSRASDYMARYPVLTMRQDNGSLVISGDKPGEGKQRAQAELRIDPATLTPQSLVFIYHDSTGRLAQKLVKTWQFQRVANVLIPKTVVDQEYGPDLSGKLDLEQERTLAINRFDTAPLDCKAEFEKLLKSNFSVYDEITGAHYLSGNPGAMLDNLSK